MNLFPVCRRLAAAGLLFVAGCVVGEVGDEGVSPLVIESTDPDVGLRGSMTIDGVEVVIESVTQGGMRETQVRGVAGDSYAVWHFEVDSGEMTGSYGDRSFGRFEDIETDQDVAAWAEVAHSRVAEVLRAASDAAQAASTEPANAAIRDELETVGRLHPSLLELAHEPGDDETAQAPGACYFGYGLHNIYPTRTYSGLLYKSAYTKPPHNTCTRWYGVKLYRRSDGALLCSDTGAGTDGGGVGATCGHNSPAPIGDYCWDAKHWDGLNAGPAQWKWTHKCVYDF